MNKEKYDELMRTIEKSQVNSYVRAIENNMEDLHMKWMVGKHLQEMEEKCGSNEEYINKWSKTLTKAYGKDFTEFNLKLMQEFYNTFKDDYILSSQIPWPYIVELLPIKDESERNYYFNEIINNNLSLFDLHKIIINDCYNKLSKKEKKNIKLIESLYNFSLETGESTIVIEGMEEVMEAMRKNCESK